MKYRPLLLLKKKGFSGVIPVKHAGSTKKVTFAPRANK